jgi:hypothetical protein
MATSGRYEVYGSYGYHWWSHPPDVYQAVGRGGQRIYVVPAQDLLMVTTAGMPIEDAPRLTELLQTWIRPAASSARPLPPDPAGMARLADLIHTAARPPQPHVPRPLPALATRIAGRTYALEPNGLSWDSISLEFPGPTEARLTITTSGQSQELAVGLDGAPHATPHGPRGPTPIVEGAWEAENVLSLHYEMINMINDYWLRLVFENNRVQVDLRETTGPMHAELRSAWSN